MIAVLKPARGAYRRRDSAEIERVQKLWAVLALQYLRSTHRDTPWTIILTLLKGISVLKDSEKGSSGCLDQY